ncbi:MAG: outer membrane protein transport protein [Bacteroidales bacterium]|nr:outer membrane protein transport protein [Bacteroidales bacterium]
MRTPFLKYVMMACLLAGFGLAAFAQADVDSPYSLFGVGQLRGKSMNVKLKGMGGAGNAMFGGGMINSANPASYAKIDSLSFLFDAGFYFKSSTFSTSNLSEPSRNASFDYVSMAFGLFPWWKTAIGVQPYSSSGYTMLVDRTVPEVGSTTTRFKGSGGLNQVFWGNGFKIGKHVAVGANVYYVFGNTQSETSLYFPDSSYYIGTRRNLDVMVNSFMFDYGVLFNTQIKDDMTLSAGLTYNQKVNLKGEQTLFVRSIEEDLETEVEYLIDTIAYAISGSKTTMPQGFGLGMALQKNERWTISADFNWMQWSKFARQGVTESLKDSWSVAAGAEFTPRHTSVTGYFTRVAYRFGGFYEHGFVCLPGNDGIEHNINKVGITAGMSLPLPRTLSKVNLAFEVGQYGTREGGLIQERYAKMDVGISVHEMWFMKRKYR